MKISKAHIAAMIAFSMWGLFPIYWKFFKEVSPWDLFGHRLLWSFVTLMLILFFKNKLGELKTIWHDPKKRLLLMASAIMISSNWLLYIYAVNTGRILEASMGYFLNPLINVFMGWMLLKEKIRSTQWPSIVLATVAIMIMLVQSELSDFPWIAITLCLTFALYGLLRKITHVGSLEGLSFETCVVIVPTLAVWFFQPTSPLTVLTEVSTLKFAVLTLSGIVTCLPLVLFAYSARQLTLQTLGFIQYLSPSFKFLCGLFIFNEPLATSKLQAFFLIWIALAWYSIESVYFARRVKAKAIPLNE